MGHIIHIIFRIFSKSVCVSASHNKMMRWLHAVLEYF